MSATNWNQTLHDHSELIRAIADRGPLLDAIADAITAAFRAGHRLLICGNGGSAADAQHIAAELVGRFKVNRRALPAIALTTDTSNLTAIGNDFGFETVFSRQVEALAGAGDLLWALSTSGNSPNVLRAAQAARERGTRIIAFTGDTGGKLAPLADWLFAVPHRSTDRIQEAHALAYHFICDRVEQAFIA